jgi:D-amino-acid dehydrogenase
LRPSLDPSYVRWLWRFRRSCSQERFDAGVRALLALNERTLDLFDAYRAAGVEFEMQSAGMVVAARTREGLDLYRAIFRRLHELGYRGGAIDELDGDALAELEPALDAGAVVAGLHATVDRFVRPEELTAALAAALRSDGAEIHENVELTGIGPSGTLETSAGSERADRVVLAAGLATARFAPMPMVGARGYSVTLAGRGEPPRHALYLAEAKLGLSPFAGGVRIAGVFELGPRRAEAPPGAGKRLVAAARPYLAGWRPDADGEPQAWAGLRPATPDGLPLLGAHPSLPGVYLATGHGMLGVTLAPASAALLAPLVLEGRAAPELAPFDPARRV